MTTYLGKSCSFSLPRVPFVNCRQFMYLVISLLVLRAGCGIWLYQFLIIAYLFILSMYRSPTTSNSAIKFRLNLFCFVFFRGGVSWALISSKCRFLNYKAWGWLGCHLNGKVLYNWTVEHCRNLKYCSQCRKTIVLSLSFLQIHTNYLLCSLFAAKSCVWS